MRIKTLHGETDVPDWLIEKARGKTKRQLWIPFPALRAEIKKSGFKRLIRELLKQKLGSEFRRKKKKIPHSAFLPHIVQLDVLRTRKYKKTRARA